MMNERGKSDGPVVPAKSPNKAAKAVAEAVEGRGPTKGNTNQQNASRTQSRIHGVSSALDRVRQRARRDKGVKFTALLHHVTIDLLRESFRALKPKAAAGVDGVTWKQYAEELEENLRELHSRLHRGAYRAKPVRRVMIPKPDGGERPLGIASLEEKVVQRAVSTVLGAIYEADFLGFSYGFRPRRNPHQALDALAVGIDRRRVNWVFDADIRGFFDSMDHEWIRRFVEHRIADRRIVHLIQKWLKAGILQDGVKTIPEAGSPQGATISPLLANIYLHYVFDLWVERWRRGAKGEVIVVRFADDLVLGFEYKSDAQRFWKELRERFARFRLELHPRKTRLLRFGTYAAHNRAVRREGKPETFDFLGFTHICGKSRQGRFLLKRWVSKKRMRSTLKALRRSILKRRHLPLPVQGAWLRSVLQGYFGYYAVPTSFERLEQFRKEVIRAWFWALRRRSQRTRLTWERMKILVERWIPRLRILHPWPSVRLTPEPEVGAQCGSSARWDLCGGRPDPKVLRAVSTATVEAQVRAKALDDRDDAAVERRDGGESMLTFDGAPDVLKDGSSEAP